MSEESSTMMDRQARATSALVALACLSIMVELSSLIVPLLGVSRAVGSSNQPPSFLVESMFSN